MRRFLIKLSYLVLPLWVFTVALVAYYCWGIAPYATSELGRVGQYPVPALVHNHILDRDYFTHVYDVEVLSDTVVDVITIGDSFTVQDKSCFENFLGASGMRVANLMVMHNNPFQAAYDLLRLGHVDSTNVKTIVVESVERSILHRLTKVNDTNTKVKTTQLGLIDNYLKKMAPSNASPLIDAKNYVLRRMGYRNVVGHCKLSKPFFSGKDPKGLYFHLTDVQAPDNISTEDSILIRSNIAKLEETANKAGVRIVYLIAADKYDVYQKYIVDNPYKPKHINERLRAMFPNRDQWVIGKELVQPLVDAGEVDLYPCGDTHWADKASQVVAQELERCVRAGW